MKYSISGFLDLNGGDLIMHFAYPSQNLRLGADDFLMNHDLLLFYSNDKGSPNQSDNRYLYRINNYCTNGLEWTKKLTLQEVSIRCGTF